MKSGDSEDKQPDTSPINLYLSSLINFRTFQGPSDFNLQQMLKRLDIESQSARLIDSGQPPEQQEEEDDDLLIDEEAEDYGQGQQQQPIFTCTSSSTSQLDEEDQRESSYFESMSSSSGSQQQLLFPSDERAQEEFLKYNSSGNMQFLFQERYDPLILQQNSEALHRQEYGGVVVYDSCARMIGNTFIQSYYELNPPLPVDFNILFSPEEIRRSNKLHQREPRERDFSSDFDKFVYKHLPKFLPERDYSGGSNSQHQFTINIPQQENILIFESRFENGNLRRAVKVNNIEYNLLLENDMNTKGHTQWFYFKVVHRYPKKQKIQFNILNLAKPQSLYQEGMKPCIYSRNLNKSQGKGWFRGGEDINYVQNQIPRKATDQSHHLNNNFLYNNNSAGEGLDFFFTLSFIYEFEEAEDEVWFAHAIPYTFTDLQHNLKEIRDDIVQREYAKIDILSKTLAGSPCPLLTITENIDSYMDYQDELELQLRLPNALRKQLTKKYRKAKKLYKQSMESKGKVRKLLRAAADEEIQSFTVRNIEEFKKVDPKYANIHSKIMLSIRDHFYKKAIIITSRVHPGEPQSSYMLKGTINYFLSDEAKELRKHFVIRIIPMLNVDGVIYGNYRCSLLGVDLNRKWVQPNVFLHPEIYFAKQMIRHMHNERRVLMYCDLHGHSRKQNAFFYACTYKNFEHEGRIKNAQLRIIPLMCCHKNELFKFTDCRFRIEKCKESTARVVIFKEFNIMNSFTLECSFYGKELDIDGTVSYPNKPKRVQHFGIKDYMSIGSQLAQVLDNYLPTEQQKLSLLSGKILEIFYDEFIKFIPPYVLKREEEKNKLINLDKNQSPDIQVIQFNQKTPLLHKLTNQSPKPSDKKLAQIQPADVIRSQSIKKQRKSFYYGNIIGGQSINGSVIASSKRDNKEDMQTQSLKKLRSENPSGFAKKVKAKRRTTIYKKDIIINESSSKPPLFQDMVDNNRAQVSDTDSFSQIINIHSHQDELLDLESFIKGVKEKEKQQSSPQKIHEEDEEGLATDSSDSEESVKNIYAQHQQSSNKGNLSPSKNNGKKILKKILESKQKEKAEAKEDLIHVTEIQRPVQTQVSFTDVSPLVKKQYRKMNIIKPIFSQQAPHQHKDSQNIEQDKRMKSQEATIDVKANRGLQRGQQKQAFQRQSRVIGSNEDIELKFDKIPHRKGSSPSQKSHDELAQEITFSQKKQGISRNNHSLTLKSNEEEKYSHHKEGQANQLFKSQEQVRQYVQPIENQRIIPLYENDLYHQSRLVSSNAVMNTSNLQYKSINTSLIQTSSQPQQAFNLKHVTGTNYEPYEDLRNKDALQNYQIIPQRNKAKSGALNQLMISPIMQNDTNQNNQRHINQPNRSKPLNEPNNYQDRQHKKKTQNINNQNSSLQRMSFKELLESSRQTRIHEKQMPLDLLNQQRNQINISANSGSVVSNHGHLLQMLKSTYQRFQQQSLITQIQKHTQDKQHQDEENYKYIARAEARQSQDKSPFYQNNISHSINQQNQDLRHSLTSQPMQPQNRLTVQIPNVINQSIPLIGQMPQTSQSIDRSSGARHAITSSHQARRLAYTKTEGQGHGSSTPQRKLRKMAFGNQPQNLSQEQRSLVSCSNQQQLSESMSQNDAQAKKASSINQRIFFIQKSAQLPPSQITKKGKPLKNKQNKAQN